MNCDTGLLPWVVFMAKAMIALVLLVIGCMCIVIIQSTYKQVNRKKAVK